MEHLFYAQLHDEFYKFIFMPCFISLLSKKLLQSIFLYYSVNMHKYTHIHTHTHMLHLDAIMREISIRMEKLRDRRTTLFIMILRVESSLAHYCINMIEKKRKCLM